MISYLQECPNVYSPGLMPRLHSVGNLDFTGLINLIAILTIMCYSHPCGPRQKNQHLFQQGEGKARRSACFLPCRIPSTSSTPPFCSCHIVVRSCKRGLEIETLAVQPRAYQKFYYFSRMEEWIFRNSQFLSALLVKHL